jgi:3-deoxy-manno-octulosonate cytidylyltransferase (CMP-KDO synthetase)
MALTLRTDSAIAIIPARMESTRLPGKPLLEISGQPMILHVAQACRASGLERVVVATDSAEISDVASSAGVEAVLTGPASCGTERVYMAWAQIGAPDSLIINVQGDEPMVSRSWVSALLRSAPGPDSVTTLARRIDRADAADTGRVKVVIGGGGEKGGTALYFSRLPVPHGSAFCWEHMGLYCFSPDSLERAAESPMSALAELEGLEQLSWMEKGLRIHVCCGEFEGISVDTPEDLEEVRKLLR